MIITQSKQATSTLNNHWKQKRFDRLWDLHQPRIWRLTARLVGSVDLADDLTQEVAVKAFQGYHAFRGGADVFTWLYRIAVNTVIRSRQRKSHPTVSIDGPEASEVTASDRGPETRVIELETRSRVWLALERLPDEQRTALILHIYEDLKYREIAAITGVPLGTVKSRINSAVNRLREELNNDL